MENNERVKGTSKTGQIRPTVSLVTHSINPVGALYSIWSGSRNNGSVPAAIAQDLYDHGGYDHASEYICSCYPEHAGPDRCDVKKVIGEIAKMAIISDLPPAEAVTFTFQIDNANVAWREQLVRSHFAQYWTQTSRTADMRCMDVNMSSKIKEYGGEKAEGIYKDTVDTIRRAYEQLMKLGVPAEEIRLQPQGFIHRVYWMISLRALLKIIQKRTSWIAQISLWSPIIEDIVKILREVSPFFDDLVGTPNGATIKNGRVVAYTLDNENEDRLYGRDHQPCDPLYLAYHQYMMPEGTDLKMYDIMKKSYIKLWSQEILDMLGWDRKDPEKVGPYDRPRSYWNDHNKEVVKDLTDPLESANE